MNEKTTPPDGQLPLPVAPLVAVKPKASLVSKGFRLATVGLFVYLLGSSSAPSTMLPKQFGSAETSALAVKEACPQAGVLTPSTSHYAELDAIWKSAKFEQQAITWLSEAVQVETESYDDLGPVGEDDRWPKFAGFHEYLARAFPRTHETLKLTKVNTYGLVFEWTGSDASLKPLLLMGHQDVVPVNKGSYDAWEHPPFSGHYDGEYIWGRGSVDDKSGLIGILSAVESILAGSDFAPRRTIVLSFGFDEEISGYHAYAGEDGIAAHLEKTYGHKGFGLILDEGGGYQELFGTTVAAIATGEKGYGDVRLTVNTIGGHSSVPTLEGHTSIGYLSLLVAHLESHPHAPYLTRENPFYSTLTCAAEHGDLPKEMDKLVKGSIKSDKALLQLEGWLHKKREYRPLITTTQAVDLISGGVKVNALPESATATINHRINVDSSTAELKKHVVKVLTSKAKEFNLTLNAFGEELVPGPGLGQVVVEAVEHWLEPAPISSTTPDDKGWFVLSGSIKSAHKTRIRTSEADSLKGDEIVTAPSVMTGNTDTRHVWNLSDQVYRYNHISPADWFVSSGVHSVNEALKASAFVNNVRAFGTLILNVNEHDI